jgi:hypothetical protein
VTILTAEDRPSLRHYLIVVRGLRLLPTAVKWLLLRHYLIVVRGLRLLSTAEEWLSLRHYLIVVRRLRLLLTAVELFWLELLKRRENITILSTLKDQMIVEVDLKGWHFRIEMLAAIRALRR